VARPVHQTFYIIESDAGVVLFDSRSVVPCDMDRFAATKERTIQHWLGKGYEIEQRDASSS